MQASTPQQLKSMHLFINPLVLHNQKNAWLISRKGLQNYLQEKFFPRSWPRLCHQPLVYDITCVILWLNKINETVVDCLLRIRRVSSINTVRLLKTMRVPVHFLRIFMKLVCHVQICQTRSKDHRISSTENQACKEVIRCIIYTLMIRRICAIAYIQNVCMCASACLFVLGYAPYSYAHCASS